MFWPLVNPEATNVIHIYMERIFLMFLDHTQRRTTVGRTPLDEWPAEIVGSNPTGGMDICLL